jgi:RNA polymerase sigma-70 factor (ECF subfamily)
MEMLSDEELVEKTLLGDRSSFGALVERYQHAAYGLAFHLLQNLVDAQDAAQEAFIRAYSNLPSLREPTRFANWLNGMVRNICMSRHRRTRDILPIEQIEATNLGDIHSTPEEILERTALRNSVMKAIDSLSDKNRLVVNLYYIDGLRYDEIANFLDISTNTVKDRLRRARRALKENMIEMVEEEFSGYRLAPTFRTEVLKVIEELKSTTCSL